MNSLFMNPCIVDFASHVNGKASHGLMAINFWPRIERLRRRKAEKSSVGFVQISGLNLKGHHWTFQDKQTRIKTSQRYCRVSNLKVQRDYYRAMEEVIKRTSTETRIWV